MKMIGKFGTLNLCLGLTNKKELVRRMIIEEQIDILCLQETELLNNLDHKLMKFPGFEYESEINNTCARVGCYLNSNISYVRRYDLEGVNSHMIVIDIKSNKNLRIVNIYRSFNPYNHQSPYDLFKYQIDLIHDAYTNNTILMGDFNLDWNKRGLNNYPFKRYFEYMNDKLSELILIQMVNMPTWSRVINGVIRESVIDHIYISDPSIASNIGSTKPIFGDHSLILCDVNLNKNKESISIKRSWLKYTKAALCTMLEEEEWNEVSDTVQGTWNIIENKIVRIVDKLVPEVKFVNNVMIKQSIDKSIKTKINKRKKLLQAYKIRRNEETKNLIKTLDKEIKNYFKTVKNKNVRRVIVPGNTGSLWKAVKAAHDAEANHLPSMMFLNDSLIEDSSLPDVFASFFDGKIKMLVEKTAIVDNVYNGRKLVNSENKMFMNSSDVRECILSLKSKNSEGFDRIPQRILVDGVEVLLQPLTYLFGQIYEQKQVPEQWLVSKTIPVFKNKGAAKRIENYRPVANLCSTSKVFEKLILKRINEIQDVNKIDLTRNGQHGFKKNRSTMTLSLELQSIIARALDNDEHVLVASLDLSSAFDVVNIELLLKRMQIVGLPEDVIELVRIWLSNRLYYVSIGGENSCMFDLLTGTVQGSVLGPVLYALFVSPLFDIEPVLSFADDSYVVKISKNKNKLVLDLEKSLESITKWLKKSGLVVNDEKTDLCLFYKNDTEPVNVRIGDSVIKSKNEISVLGIIFDSKLQWSNQVSTVIKKANKALNAIKIIRKFFTSKELLLLLTSNYYSVLYYNCEVWNIGSLKQNLKNQLLSASGNALRVAFHYPSQYIGFMELHKRADRATPEMFGRYRLSLLLYRTFNDAIPETEWVEMNFQQIVMSRQTVFKIVKTNINKVGLNILCNRLHEINGKIKLDWLNMSKCAYKITCKKNFLTFAS